MKHVQTMACGACSNEQAFKLVFMAYMVMTHAYLLHSYCILHFIFYIACSWTQISIRYENFGNSQTFEADIYEAYLCLHGFLGPD